jgi:hypothetical protein
MLLPLVKVRAENRTSYQPSAVRSKRHKTSRSLPQTASELRSRVTCWTQEICGTTVLTIVRFRNP